jgi:hypothetical protein
VLLLAGEVVAGSNRAMVQSGTELGR